MAKVRRGLGKLGWALLTLMMAAWVVVPLSALALDAVLVISGLTTNTVGGASENGTPIESFSFGLDNVADLHSGSPPAPALHVHDLRVVKAIDGTTPELLYHGALQDSLSDATLYVGATQTKAGGAPSSYDFSIQMTNVIVKSVEQSGGLNAPTETVVLHFEEVAVQDGASGLEFNWDISGRKGDLQ